MKGVGEEVVPQGVVSVPMGMESEDIGQSKVWYCMIVNSLACHTELLPSRREAFSFITHLPYFFAFLLDS